MRAKAALGVGFVNSPARPEPPQLSHSFTTEQTSWGPYVTSIHGLAGSTEDRTYWQFLSAGKPLDEGGRGAQGQGRGEPVVGITTSQPHSSLSHRGWHLQTTRWGAHPGCLQHLLMPPKHPGPLHGAINCHSSMYISVFACVSLGENTAHIPFVFLPAYFHELSSSLSLSQHHTQAQPHANFMHSVSPEHQQSLSPAATGLFLQPHSCASAQPVLIPSQALMAFIRCNYLHLIITIPISLSLRPPV